MCYICGNKPPKELVIALRIWRSKTPRPKEFRPSWGDTHDGTKPARTKHWKPADFVKYQQRVSKTVSTLATRYNTVGYDLGDLTRAQIQQRYEAWNRSQPIGPCENKVP